MKRILSLVLSLLLLISAVAYASEVPQFSEDLFTVAKQALTYLASGEYERLVTLLPFSDVAPSASEWKSFFEGNFTSIADGVVQTEYAVAYWIGSSWSLALPVSEPNDDSVETIVLTSSDGISFTGYRFATWAEVRGEYLFASYVVWDKEYIESTPILAVD